MTHGKEPCLVILKFYISGVDSRIGHRDSRPSNGCHSEPVLLTHWRRVMHICIGKLTNIGSDNALSPGRRQAIIWTNAGILLIGPLWTNFSEILIRIETSWFNKMHFKMSSAKWRPFCLSLDVLMESMIFVIKHYKEYWFEFPRFVYWYLKDTPAIVSLREVSRFDSDCVLHADRTFCCHGDDRHVVCSWWSRQLLPKIIDS